MNKTNNFTKKRCHKSRHLHRNSLAGKAIAAGGFGCIFKPSLRCKTRKISKKQNLNDII